MLAPSSNSLPEWQRAYGDSVVQGRIKQTPEDFQVVEQLGFPVSNDGEHDFLWIEKTGGNTAWVARALAQHAGVAARDVGFAGLKDRQAITQQWFSVRRPGGGGTDWSGFAADGVKILSATRNQRKLKRGAHRGNLFRITVHADSIDHSDIEQRLALIRAEGVPNFFGAQRFGRQGNNLCLAAALFKGKRLPREQRSIALSAARSYLFNHILSARIADGSWNQALPGDVLNLDGSASVFTPEQFDASIHERITALDIHPTAALWGEGDLLATGAPGRLEQAIAAAHPEFVQGLLKARLKMARRSLRLVVSELHWEIDDAKLHLKFGLGRGSYATAVLRELLS